MTTEDNLSENLPEAEKEPSEQVEQSSTEEVAEPVKEVTEEPEGEEERAAKEFYAAIEGEVSRLAQSQKDKELTPIYARIKELEQKESQSKVEQGLQSEWTQGASYIESLERSETSQLEKVRADVPPETFQQMQQQLTKNQQDRRKNVQVGFDLHKQQTVAAETQRANSAWAIGRRYNLNDEDIAELQKLNTDTEKELKAQLLQSQKQTQETATAKAKVEKTPQTFAVGVEGKTSTGDEAFTKRMADPNYMPTQEDYERWRKMEEKFR